jgi:hypothetical protein
MVFGDIPAMSKVMKMKGVNGICPCRFCNVHGAPSRSGDRTTYYIPHDRRNLGLPSIDPSALPMRLHADFMRSATEVDSLPPGGPRTALEKTTGIKGIPLLARCPGIRFPHSFPIELMHLFYINTVDNLITLYSDDYKHLDTGSSNYRIPRGDWSALCGAAKAAGDTMPGVFGCRVHDFSEEGGGGQRSAEMRGIWALYLAPSVLRGRLPPRHYKHFMELVDLIRLCTQLNGISTSDVATIRAGFIRWVKYFEKLVHLLAAG